jgi:hypothetical protein
MNQSHDSLDQLLRTLPREVAPARDLWPGIAAATRRAPNRWPLALAAGIAVACVSAALTWVMIGQRQSAPVLVASQTDLPPVTLTAAHYALPTDARYVAARAALERDFEAGLVLLAPDTQQRIRASLATIRQANHDIRQALENDPASPVLLKLLASTWQQEIDLYSNVVQSTQPLMRTT